MLFGYKDEAIQKYLSRQETMGFDVPRGKVVLGFYVAKNVGQGNPFIITGSNGFKYSFVVSERLDEGKGMMDQGVSFNIADLQQVLGMPGKINRIEALGCVCSDGRIKNARKQVQAVFPDLEVTELGNIADARENQRLMMNKYGAFIIPFVMISCLLVTGLLFYQNITIRRREIGLLKALGNSNYSILFMVLLKAFVLGLAGGIAGFFIGTAVAGYFGKEIFRFTAMNIKPVWAFFYYSVFLFPFLWILSSWIPALIASKTDAALTLSEE
jgi:putative ABC transport system permease protein